MRTSSLVLTALLTLCSSAHAGEVIKADYFNQCSGSWLFDTELMFIQPNRSDAVAAGASEKNIAPRFTAGYENNQGAGYRFRYWEYDHSQGLSSIDTYTFDAEYFKNIQFGCRTNVEVGAGLRYLSYDDFNWAVGGTSGFDGIGPTVAAKASHRMPFGIDALVRARFSLLTG